MRRILAASMVAVAVLSACGGKGAEEGSEGEGDTGACASESSASSTAKVPPGFPAPEGVVITDVSTAGPSTIVEGSFEGDLDAAVEAFKDGFENAGFDVTDSEQEEDDAEVNFSGNNTTGQVKLSVPCEGRVGVSITIRPA